METTRVYRCCLDIGACPSAFGLRLDLCKCWWVEAGHAHLQSPRQQSCSMLSNVGTYLARGDLWMETEVAPPCLLYSTRMTSFWGQEFFHPLYLHHCIAGHA